MIPFVITIHVIACFLLIVIILIQAGRGGGLVEGFSGVESMFGTKTNVFLTKLTSIFSIVFFVTCLSLALLSARQSRSLLKTYRPSKLPTETAATAGKATAVPAQPAAQEQKEIPQTQPKATAPAQK